MGSTVKDVRDYKAKLQESFSKDIAEFEKNFLLVGAGVLTFTITFIKDIVGTDEVTGLIWLFAGWIFIGLSVALIIISYFKSAYASSKTWTKIDDYMKAEQLTTKKSEEAVSDTQVLAIKDLSETIVRNTKKMLRIFRIIAIVSFLAGLSSVACFSAFNFMQKKPQKQSKPDEWKISTHDGKKTFVIDNLTVEVNDSLVILHRKNEK